METYIIYQAQFSEDGKIWRVYRPSETCESFDEVKKIYDDMVEYHKLPYNVRCKYHRIVKLTVETEVIL